MVELNYTVELNDKTLTFSRKIDFASHFGVSEQTVEMWLQQRCRPKKKFNIKKVFVDKLLILDFTGRV